LYFFVAKDDKSFGRGDAKDEEIERGNAKQD